MTITITPDLPFKNGIEKVLANTLADTVPFLLMMELFRSDSEYTGLLPYLKSLTGRLQHDFLYLVGAILLVFLWKGWYAHKRIKNITKIDFDQATDKVTVIYKNILGRKERAVSFSKKDLFVGYNVKKEEALFSPKLQEPYVLNKSTGFSPEKLLELENIYKQMVTIA